MQFVITKSFSAVLLTALLVGCGSSGDNNTTTDTDGDGVIDTLDAFPNDASESTDSDGDGVGDNADVYPNDASRSVALNFSQAALFTSSRISSNKTEDPFIIRSGDLNGDGFLDLVIGSQITGDVHLFTNDTDGTFTRTILASSGNTNRDIAIADIDGDDDLDVITSDSGTNLVTWFENDGTGIASFDNTHEYALTDARSVAAEDIDGDGDMDFVAAGSSSVSLFLNDGEQNFTEHVINDDNDIYKTVIVADISDDGILDVVSGSNNATQPIIGYINDGDENFTAQAIATTTSNLGKLYAADVDGDGDIDLQSASASDNTLAWYQNDGTGNFVQFNVDTAANGVSDVSAADLDNDGDIDLIAAVRSDNTVAWYQNDGAENFTKRIVTDSVNSVLRILVADLNNDNRVDVVSSTFFSDTVHWYENSALFETDVVEGETVIAMLPSVDENGQALTYALEIDDNTDADFFNLDTRLGLFNFVETQFFSAPNDANGDGVYETAVTVNNGIVDTKAYVNARVVFSLTDFDGDGTENNSDAFPFDATENTDTDGDGIGDNSDETPFGPPV